MIFATILCALSWNSPFGFKMIAMFGFFRFVLGIGIGGDYPLSAVIASEFATVSRRGFMMSAVFAMQGVGILVAPLVALLILNGYKGAIEEDYLKVDMVWRLCVLFGIIPAIAALYFRLTIPESPRYTAHVVGDVDKAREDIDLMRDNTKPFLQTVNQESGQKEERKGKNGKELSFKEFFSKWKNLKILLGCSISWFALDVAFYGSNLNQSFVISEIGFAPVESDTYAHLQKLILGNLIIVFFGTCSFIFIFKQTFV